MRAWGVVVALLLALAAPGRAAASEGDGALGPEQLVPLGTEQVTGRLQVLRFRTPALGAAETQVRVLLPSDYDPSGATRYPVLYLLHGASGSSSTWLANVDVAAITADVPLIVVMPDGGLFGYYADWWNGGAGGPPRWETYHLDQLLPWIDAHYPTVGTRDGRAITGDSMGGLGAMHYAAARPDLFTAAASFSGAVDTNLFVAPPVVELSTIAAWPYEVAAAFGPRLTQEVRWRGHNPVDLAENLRGLYLRFDVATLGDPIELAMYAMATTMDARLDDLGIAHEMDAYLDGCHCWIYYERDLRQLLPRLMDRFAHPVAPPSPFSYRSIDRSYSMWGWDVHIDRPAVEFSRLFDAGPHGFGLQGSGSAVVTTAPLFAPGQEVAVTVTSGAGGGAPSRATIVAGADGRLTVPVSLGPGHPYQQFSPEGWAWALARGAPGTWPSVTATVTFAAAESPATAGAAPAVPAREAGTLPATGRDDADLLLAAVALVAAVAGRRVVGAAARRP